MLRRGVSLRHSRLTIMPGRGQGSEHGHTATLEGRQPLPLGKQQSTRIRGGIRWRPHSSPDDGLGAMATTNTGSLSSAATGYLERGSHGESGRTWTGESVLDPVSLVLDPGESGPGPGSLVQDPVSLVQDQ